MRKFLSAWVFAIMLLLAAVAPAWAALGVATLTTPVLPANAARTTIDSANNDTPTSYNSTPVLGWAAPRPGRQALSEVPPCAPSALHFPLPTRFVR